MAHFCPQGPPFCSSFHATIVSMSAFGPWTCTLVCYHGCHSSCHLVLTSLCLGIEGKKCFFVRSLFLFLKKDNSFQKLLPSHTHTADFLLHFLSETWVTCPPLITDKGNGLRPEKELNVFKRMEYLLST